MCAVKINGKELDLTTLVVEESLPLKAGGVIKVSINHFQMGKGTVVTVATPLVTVNAKLVRTNPFTAS